MIEINNKVYRNLQEQVLYLTTKIQEDSGAKVTNVEFVNPNVTYSTQDGALLAGAMTLTYAGGTKETVMLDFNIPVVGDGITIDANETNDGLVISGGGGIGVVVTIPQGATQGTLTQAQYALLSDNDNNWVTIDNERYILMDKEHEPGIRVYTHNGYATQGAQKYFCLTVATLAFTIAAPTQQLTIYEFNFKNGIYKIAQTVYDKLMQPALTVYGAITDPNSTEVSYQIVAQNNLIYNNDEGLWHITYKGSTVDLKTFIGDGSYSDEGAHYVVCMGGYYETDSQGRCHFYNSDVTKYFDPDMTWTQWVTSTYNDLGWTIDEDGLLTSDSSNITCELGTSIQGTDKIYPFATYQDS